MFKNQYLNAEGIQHYKRRNLTRFILQVMYFLSLFLSYIHFLKPTYFIKNY